MYICRAHAWLGNCVAINIAKSRFWSPNLKERSQYALLLTGCFFFVTLAVFAIPVILTFIYQIEELSISNDMNNFIFKECSLSFFQEVVHIEYQGKGDETCYRY